MDESVVERSIDVGNAEYELALADLRSKLDSGFLCNTCFFRWLYPEVSNPIHQTVGQIKLDCMCSSTCDKNDRDAPSSKASEYEKLELNVRRVRELTAPIRVWASASIPNTRTQISHLAMRAIMMPRYVALDKVYFDLVMDASQRSAFAILIFMCFRYYLPPYRHYPTRAGAREDFFVIIWTTLDIPIGHTGWFKPDSLCI